MESKKTNPGRGAHGSTGDETTSASPSEFENHVLTGHVLWTMTKGAATMQATRWKPHTGVELQVALWLGPQIDGLEDLTWSQILPDDDALEALALSKKRQLEAAGWVERASGKSRAGDALT